MRIKAVWLESVFLKLKNQDKFNLSNKKAGLREEIIIIACSAYYSFIIRFAYWRSQAIHWRPQTFHWRLLVGEILIFNQRPQLQS